MNMQQIMKQAQQMQKKMETIQAEVGAQEVEASAGGGMVKAVMNGKQELLSLSIEKEIVNPEDVEMLQDLVVAAVNEATKKAQEMMQQRMNELTGGLGLNLPGF